MAKVKIELTGAEIDGNPLGSVISVEEKDANYFERVGYARKVEEVKEKPKPKQTPKQKPKAIKKTTSEKKTSK